MGRGLGLGAEGSRLWALNFEFGVRFRVAAFRAFAEFEVVYLQVSVWDGVMVLNVPQTLDTDSSVKPSLSPEPSLPES